MFSCSPVYYANLKADEPICVNQGGTWSTKTYSILQVLATKAISEADKIITVCGQDIPNLKRGAMRDFQQIIASSPELKSLIESYNATDRIYKFKSGSIIEFVSYANEQDARNGKRDYLFINEANGIAWEIAEQLITRTKVQTYIDYNPSSEFWSHEKLTIPGIFGNKKVRLIISDHRHNPFIPKEQHEYIEARAKEDPEWGKVYARGMTGKIEGLIFRNYNIIEGLPKDAKLIAYGLDFGYTNDPTAMSGVYMQNGELYLHEYIYETGLTNPDINTKALNVGVLKEFDIIADSAEPKSIEELYRFGWNIYGAEKGADSIKNSIDILKRYKLNITRESTNIRKEIGRYKWAIDKDGKTLNKPIDFMNHAIDSIRYVALNKLSENASFGYVFM